MESAFRLDYPVIPVILQMGVKAIAGSQMLKEAFKKIAFHKVRGFFLLDSKKGAKRARRRL